MSRTTETLHVRGARTARVVEAVEGHLLAQHFERVPEAERARAEKTEGDLVRIALRRDGQWTTIADTRGTGRAADSGLDDWARRLSKALDRSVLAIWTWDGEDFVTATRWKRGKKRGTIAVPGQVRRDAQRVPRAPAKALWPWLPKATRAAILRDGVRLTAPADTTGDADLDELLEGFDDVDEDDVEIPDGEGGQVYVGIFTAVEALGAAIGLKNPFLDPWSPQKGDVELLFRRSAQESVARGARGGKAAGFVVQGRDAALGSRRVTPTRSPRPKASRSRTDRS